MAGNDRESGAAPVQVRGTVLTVRRVDAYVAMTVVAPAIATRFKPGQFIAIAVGGPQSGMLGRRSFSIHDVRPDHGGAVEFVFLPREPGAQWLADCRSREGYFEDAQDLAKELLPSVYVVQTDPVCGSTATFFAVAG